MKILALIFIYVHISFASQNNAVTESAYAINCFSSDRRPATTECKTFINEVHNYIIHFSNGKAKRGWSGLNSNDEMTDYFLYADEHTKIMQLKIVRRRNEKNLILNTHTQYSKIGDLANISFEAGDEQCTTRAVHFTCHITENNSL